MFVILSEGGLVSDGLHSFSYV